MMTSSQQSLPKFFEHYEEQQLGSFAFWAVWSCSWSAGPSISEGFGVSLRIPFKINARAHVV